MLHNQKGNRPMEEIKEERDEEFRIKPTATGVLLS